ncbi:hypothetical protein PRUB_a1609 [Pseudoalteromonas rubra]|uniref:BON domain-containing protein n=1 Tax=Pseudoalteromonas rubra TaxID=43658 RepID=A0A8T0CCY0_9GAMM|nr:division/outer membrane stress-associated lipid-binding lipoprotein [Pseudoalteromonas rubra]KAF7788607.1 hypothetical protein PRUB_a1609 [Pseudoalteromonas rubra]
MLKRPALILCSVLLIQGCAAAVVAGTAGAVTSANDRRTLGSQIDDNNIEIKGTLALKRIPALANHANISLVSVNGHVLMVGQVSTTEMKQQAHSTLQGVQGIKQIYNQLRIGSNIGITTQTNDSWLTTKVKTKLIADDHIDGSNIKVVTENSEVFLMGLVNQTEAERAVDIARNVHGVQKVVKAFEIL